MNLSAEITKNKMVINRLTRAQYEALELSGLINANELYLVEDTVLDAQGKRLTNLLSGELSSDAVTVEQLSNELCDALADYYPMSETSSASELSVAFENVSVDLSEYYKKSETSGAGELSVAFENVSVDLSEYYKKSETSSAAEISSGLNVLSNYYTQTQTGQLIAAATQEAKSYTDSQVSGISTSLSDTFYLKSETSSAGELSIAFSSVSVDAYKKSETSSAAELSVAFNSVSVDAYKKSETSSAIEISAGIYDVEYQLSSISVVVNAEIAAESAARLNGDTTISNALVDERVIRAGFDSAICAQIPYAIAVKSIDNATISVDASTLNIVEDEAGSFLTVILPPPGDQQVADLIIELSVGSSVPQITFAFEDPATTTITWGTITGDEMAASNKYWIGVQAWMNGTYFGSTCIKKITYAS